jgi:hypothetical protein
MLCEKVHIRGRAVRLLKTRLFQQTPLRGAASATSATICSTRSPRRRPGHENDGVVRVCCAIAAVAGVLLVKYGSQIRAPLYATRNAEQKPHVARRMTSSALAQAGVGSGRSSLHGPMMRVYPLLPGP